MATTSHTLDLLILLGFLVLNIIVGFRYRGKSKSFQEYAIGDKKFSTATLTATIVATWMSGSHLFVCLEQTYSTGLYYVIAIIIGCTAGLLITGNVIGPRMGKFLNNVSVPELLGKVYGNQVQAIAGISTVLSTIGYIAVQFKAISRILTIFLYHGNAYSSAGNFFNEEVVTIIAATIIILYSTSGGVKAVTFTDVIQFLTFGTLLPVLALVIWHNLKDPHQVAHMLTTNPSFSFKEVVRWTPEFQGTLILMCYLMTPALPPELFQRMVMARDVGQVKRSIGYATLIDLAIDLCMIWIAILLLVDQPGLDPSKLVQHIVNTYTYPGLRGFLCVGIIALAMSTADSALNSCAVVITNDILPPLRIQKVRSLNTAKWATLILGFLAVLLTLKVQNILTIILGSACFYVPIVVIPMLLAIFGFETSKRVVLMAMGAGATTALACLLYFKSVNSFFPGMFVNFLVMMGAHYLLGEQGGWGHNPLPTFYHTQDTRSKWKQWREALRQFQLMPYLENLLPKQDQAYLLLAFYIFTTTYASLYLLPQEVARLYPSLYKGLQYSVTLATTFFLAFPIWPKGLRAKKLLTWIWPASIGYTLFVVGAMLAIISGFGLPQLMLLMLNFVVTVLFLSMPMAISMLIAGSLLAVLLFQQYTGLPSLPGTMGPLQFKLVYGLLLCSSSLIALFKYKQAYNTLERHNKLLTTERRVSQDELVKALNHEARFFSEVSTAGTTVLEAVRKKVETFSQQALRVSAPQQLTPVRHALEEAHQALQNTMLYLQNVVYRVQGHLQLKVDTVLIDNLLAEALAVLKIQSTQQQPRIKNRANIQELQCDPIKIQQLLVNALLYAQQNNSAQQPVLLGIQKTTLGYPIPSVKNYIKEIPALCITISSTDILPEPKTLYMGTIGNPSLQVPQSMQDWPLLDNQHIVDAHYGTVELIKENEEALTQVYVIPMHLREVRPSMMDLPQMGVGSIEEVSKIVLPEETALLTKLQNESSMNMELAEKAIMYIKKYHGLMKRKSGEPFYLHPIAVAEILLSYTQDQAAILAALLHDTVEDTPLTLSEIGVVFGPDVAAIVNKLTHLDGQFHRISMDAHENLRQLLEETDVRVLQVKLADRTHNVRTIEGHPQLAKQKKIAEETLHFFVPIAKYLGLKQIEEELQELIAAVMKKR